MIKTNSLGISIFVLGLAAVVWVGLGYVGGAPPALAVTVLIALLYLVGGLELYRYRQATVSLGDALAALGGQESPPLADWLQRLDRSLRGAVQLRVEGGRAGLPVPALTPYLVGMLVLLGMLGTLLGMALTLRGTGIALQTATDLQAVRDSLAAPVSGLGVAFGASIAGVASSAALGLLSALVRRERSRAVEVLDAHIATTLRGHSQAHQRASRQERALELLQVQAAAVPTLVERLDTMMARLEQQAQAAHDRQARQQDAFHASTRSAYQQLADSVGQSLTASAAEGARLAGKALVPVMESAMADIAQQTATVHGQVTAGARGHLQALAAELAASTAGIRQGWDQALSAQADANRTHAEALAGALQAFDSGFSQRAEALLERIGERMQVISDGTAAGWEQALATQLTNHEALASRQQQALDGAVDALSRQATALVAGVSEAHGKLQQSLTERDEQRLAAWRDNLSAISGELRTQWTGISEELRAQWTGLTEQNRAHASETTARISRLLEAAAEGPRAAAETIAELRQTLSDSMARDAAMLEERTRMLETLDTLLTAVNSASGEQRAAIDALVSTSSDLLQRAGNRFGEQIETGEHRLEQASGRLAGGVEQVAALGTALAAAMQAFSDSSTGLAERLEAIEAALERSQERSDEQLAYYVAQAREVVDLSVLAQRQIIGELQQLGGHPGGAEAEVA